MKEKFVELIRTENYNNEQYIIDVIKMLSESSEVKNAFNKLAELEDTKPITSLFFKMEKSLDKLLETEDYENIKTFIKMYTKTKYNEEINMCFSHKIQYKKTFSGRICEAVEEHPLVKNMEHKMAEKIIEYSKQDYDGCMKFIEEIPEFFVSENKYGNSYYMRKEVLPTIMGVKEILDSNEDNTYNVDLDCKQTLKNIIKYLKKKKSDFGVQTGKRNIDKSIDD